MSWCAGKQHGAAQRNSSAHNSVRKCNTLIWRLQTNAPTVLCSKELLNLENPWISSANRAEKKLPFGKDSLEWVGLVKRETRSGGCQGRAKRQHRELSVTDLGVSWELWVRKRPSRGCTVKMGFPEAFAVCGH